MSCLTGTDEDVLRFDVPEGLVKNEWSSINMSSDDPAFPGWDNHRSAEDIFTSPLWTDPSPALTDHNSFDVESCGPSPLLADDLDGPPGDIAQMPLFGDMTLFSPAQRLETSFESGNGQNGATSSSAPAEFSLFPEVKNPPSPPRGQLAFNPSAHEPVEDPATMLLRALQGAAVVRQTQAPVSTASPKMISTPPGEGEAPTSSDARDTSRAASKPALHHSATAPSLSTTAACESSEEPCSHGAGTACRRGTKRRLGVEDLLPLDAPIQARNYLGPSATSRKDWVPPSSIDHGPTPEELAAINAESDPLKAKRLSNTLAARRSRHRKAQERLEFQERIAQLEAEVASWKKRCERAEGDRDELSEKLKRCKCTSDAE